MNRYEVEMKFRGADHDDLARRLSELGARRGEPVEQEDAYLAHPARDFRATNEALRLRREGTANKITYKGPKLGGPTKTREEIELPYAGGEASLDAMRRLFDRLGFRAVATVRKVRVPFQLGFEGRPVEVGLDNVDRLGHFAEVEAIAEGPDDLAAAQATVQSLAARLGLTPDAVEVRSYLRMLLEGSG